MHVADFQGGTVPPDPLAGPPSSRHVACLVETHLGCADARDVLKCHCDVSDSEKDKNNKGTLLAHKILVAYRALVGPVLRVRPFVALKVFTGKSAHNSPIHREVYFL